jgi:hypothetical protein
MSIIQSAHFLGKALNSQDDDDSDGENDERHGDDDGEDGQDNEDEDEEDVQVFTIAFFVEIQLTLSRLENVHHRPTKLLF